MHTVRSLEQRLSIFFLRGSNANAFTSVRTPALALRYSASVLASSRRAYIQPLLRFHVLYCSVGALLPAHRLWALHAGH